MNDGGVARAACLHAWEVLHWFYVANMGKVHLATMEALGFPCSVYI